MFVTANNLVPFLFLFRSFECTIVLISVVLRPELILFFIYFIHQQCTPSIMFRKMVKFNWRVLEMLKDSFNLQLTTIFLDWLCMVFMRFTHNSKKKIKQKKRETIQQTIEHISFQDDLCQVILLWFSNFMIQ